MKLTEEEFVEYVETLHLQNITGRETPEAAFKSGIIAAYEEFKQLSLGTVVQVKPEVCECGKKHFSLLEIEVNKCFNCRKPLRAN
jgi:hypothetical protein